MQLLEISQFWQGLSLVSHFIFSLGQPYSSDWKAYRSHLTGVPDPEKQVLPKMVIALFKM